MFSRKELENILFLDIETASITSSYEELPERIKEHWDKKSKYLLKREDEEITIPDLFTKKAAIFSEFGKVITISVGYLRFEGDLPKIRMKSYFGPDEKAILRDFAKMADQFTQNPGRTLCAHNGKEFDFPYLGRRYVTNGMVIPNVLRIQGKKPWEINLIDTMELWKFGDYKSFTSLDLLTAILDVPSPKDDIDGSDVGRVFWQDEDHDRIRKYCEQDVLATAQVMLRFSREKLITPDRVETL